MSFTDKRTHASVTQSLAARNLLDCPKWLPASVAYETLMGSIAYGVSNDTSDCDVYGFCLPPKDDVFPHLRGVIPGFGKPYDPFTTWQQHHIKDADALGGTGREYDISLFSIVRYFHLLMENNPNVLDSLFTAPEMVLHSTRVGEMVRENRRVFLHRGAWHKFKGYAYAQLHKMEIKTPQEGSRRAETVKEFGFDLKFAYQIVRLLDEVEQILTTGDVDLTRDKERLKAIRRGEWTAAQIKEWFTVKERDLEAAYQNSPLPYSPDEPRIKALLLECLEAHYGSLEKALVVPGRERELLARIKALCESAGV